MLKIDRAVRTGRALEGSGPWVDWWGGVGCGGRQSPSQILPDKKQNPLIEKTMHVLYKQQISFYL